LRVRGVKVRVGVRLRVGVRMGLRVEGKGESKLGVRSRVRVREWC
jgi:hypothetical protein